MNIKDKELSIEGIQLREASFNEHSFIVVVVPHVLYVTPVGSANKTAAQAWALLKPAMLTTKGLSLNVDNVKYNINYIFSDITSFSRYLEDAKTEPETSNDVIPTKTVEASLEASVTNNSVIISTTQEHTLKPLYPAGGFDALLKKELPDLPIQGANGVTLDKVDTAVANAPMQNSESTKMLYRDIAQLIELMNHYHTPPNVEIDTSIDTSCMEASASATVLMNNYHGDNGVTLDEVNIAVAKANMQNSERAKMFYRSIAQLEKQSQKESIVIDDEPRVYCGEGCTCFPKPEETTQESNPIHNLKELEVTTLSGVGGRSARTLGKRSRKYHNNDLGSISEYTPDSGMVAMEVTYNHTLQMRCSDHSTISPLLGHPIMLAAAKKTPSLITNDLRARIKNVCTEDKGQYKLHDIQEELRDITVNGNPSIPGYGACFTILHMLEAISYLYHSYRRTPYIDAAEVPLDRHMVQLLNTVAHGKNIDGMVVIDAFFYGNETRTMRYNLAAAHSIRNAYAKFV